MPVTLAGNVHPGHMLVDWAVLPRYQSGPVAVSLFRDLLDLPGRKYGSCGTLRSETAFAKRAVRIPAVMAAALLQPLRALLLERLRFRLYALPSTVSAMPFALPGRAESIAPSKLQPAEPADPVKTAFVRRDGGFWDVFVSGRSRNSALSLRLLGGKCQGSAVIKVLEVGPLRHAVLLAFRADPATDEAVRELGRSL